MDNSTKLLEKLNEAIDKKPYILLKKKSNKLKIILSIIFIIIFLIIVIYVIKFFIGKNKKGEVFIDEFHSLKPYTLEYTFIANPKNSYDYSINFWLYLKDIDKNHNLWRSIFYKGNEDDYEEKTINYETWDRLSNELNEQSPGLWMHPNSNDLRLAFTTYNTKLYCEMNKSKNECLNLDYCKYDDRLEKCNNINAHPKQDFIKYNVQNIEKYNIEYIDIKNIPLKKMTHFSFILQNKILNIYINGKLLIIHKFMGEPIFNNRNLHINYPNSLDFSLFNFEYKPYTITGKQQRIHYKDIPNTDKFTKSYRLKSYLKRLDFKNVIKTFFK